MKVFFLLTTVIVFSFSNLSNLDGQCTTLTCTSSLPSNATIGEPYFGNGCQSNIPKILSRPIRTSSLWTLLWENNPSWDLCNYPIGQSDFCDPSVFAVNCQWTVYCPTKYCEQINKFPELNASIILRAFGPWGNLHRLKDGESLWDDVMKQIPCDINAAYDLYDPDNDPSNGIQGLRRPVIQAAIFENIPSAGKGDPNFEIPMDVMIAFMNNDPEYDSNIYQPGKLFERHRIILDSQPNRWDVTKIEARMWVYYLATRYIDAGYTSLHLGDINTWATNDLLGSVQLENTARLVKMIRQYASSPNVKKNVIINVENFPNDKLIYGGMYDPEFLPNEKRLIFDFDVIAARLREINDPNNYCSCNFDSNGECIENECPNDSEIPFSIDDLPPCNTSTMPGCDCSDQPGMAFIDDCTLKRRRTEGGGISPSGCVLEEVPYIVDFDFSRQFNSQQCLNDILNSNPANPPLSGCGDGHIYDCFSDLGWWIYALKGNCKKTWLKYFICNVSQSSNGLGSLAIPYSNYDDENDLFYLLSEDNPELIDVIKEAWELDDLADFNISEECLGNQVSYGPNCNNIIPNPGDQIIFRRKKKQYTFTAIDTDCISEYSWHIRGPYGWEPSTLGQERVFCPPLTGEYFVELKQDHSASETTVIVNQQIIYLEQHCCEFLNIEITPCIDGEPCFTGGDTSSGSFSAQVYPNPAGLNANLLLNSEDDAKYTIELFTLLGQKIHSYSDNQLFSTGEHTIGIDLSKKLNGVYLLQIKKMNTNEVKVLRLLKNSNIQGNN